MSILDNESDIINNMDKNADDYLAEKLMIITCKNYSNDIYRIPNNTKNQIGRDIFNRPIQKGDWVIYNSSWGYNNDYKLATVIKVTSKRIKIRYLLYIDKEGNYSFTESAVACTSVMKISDKMNFYKEIVNNEYININK